ncbi:DUF4259 domain-containing protein [Chitinophaga agri]|uniref:DUF4259 domain-containing protein n=1 Tax=Chitinophaga agri TaxID=2703787 RepID=A0A6B9ZA60_9BACT|nr:DUF4259 domain-containing protein [Chitinophaga agri]QHS59148.1 DUF4259 domain-containing protein [Chitinophaga agri]
MGTWANGSFGNDDAGDWVIDFSEQPNFDFLTVTLQGSIDNPNDAGLNMCAIAAAEVICILDGKIPLDYEEVSHNLAEVIELLKSQPVPMNLRELAVIAVSGIIKQSELKELWEGDEEWEEEVSALKSRLLR